MFLPSWSEIEVDILAGRGSLPYVLGGLLRYVEVRIPQTGYLVPGCDTLRAQPDTQSSWDVAAAVAAVSWSKYEQK